MPFVCTSFGSATYDAITSAVAHGEFASTVTSGGAISGYCSIDSTDIDMAPARTIRIERTDDRIGRSMKKCVNMALGLQCGLRRKLHRLPRHHLQHAVDHHALAALQALEDHDVLRAVVIAHHHRPQLRHLVL